MRRLDALQADIGVLRAVLRGMPPGPAHAQRLAAFYAPQAVDYDRFRERLLHGRSALVQGIPLGSAARVVDLGGGTGRNIEFFGARAQRIASYEVVDLCEPLLERARARGVRYPQLRAIEADATRWQPDAPVDVVILSYALTMIPDWQAAIANARAMLKPGGMLAAVDFHVSAAAPVAGREHHGWFTRAFWPRWFGHDGVVLDAQRLDALCEAFPRHDLVEARATVPYLPLLHVPYYRFLGYRP
ncbi:MAG: class I SAM-dependent methyltransferase [Xanthomonadales bacterium]|nr:class I SAM-dependent methyltransferase [Xanthomonadales bacterium]